MPRHPAMLLAATLAIISLIAGSVIHISQPGRTTLIRRFGKTVALKQDGGLSLTTPFDSVEEFDSAHIERLETGFVTSGARTYSDHNVQEHLWDENHTYFSKVFEQSLFVTADEFTIDISFVTHFTTSDLRLRLSRATSAESVIQSVIGAAIGTAIGKRSLDQLLTGDRADMAADVIRMAEATIASYNLGVRLTGGYFVDIGPPAEVIAAFREVATARERKQAAILEAEALRYQLIPESRGEVAAAVAAAGERAATALAAAESAAHRAEAIGPVYQAHKASLTLKNRMDVVTGTLSTRSLVVAPGKVLGQIQWMPTPPAPEVKAAIPTTAGVSP